MQISNVQKQALDVVKDMIDRSNTSVPDYGTKIMTLILGILNVDCRVDNTITDIEGDKTLPINPNDDNDKIHINIPDWIKNVPTPPFVSGDYQPPQVWYNNEPKPIQTNVQERRYTASISCTDNKNGIVHTTNNVGNVQYTGDFKDEQTSFNDK